MSTPHIARDEIHSIKNELVQIEATIQKLQEKRINLLQRLNHIRSSAHVLPPEVLGNIFEHTRPPAIHADPGISPSLPDPPDEDAVLALIRLGHVSSYWRQVAWSMPQLWTSLVTNVGGSSEHGVVGILELYFRNARNLPFSLDISFGHNQKEDGLEKFIPASMRTLELVEALIFEGEYSKKVEYLRLRHVPTHWLVPISRKLHQLKNISILGAPYMYQRQTLWRSSPPGPPPVSFAELPHLRSLELGFCDRHWEIELPYRSMTKLALNSVPIDTIAKLLTRCPSLVDFTSRFPGNPIRHSPRPNFIRATTNFPHLRDFSWFYHPSSWCLATLERIQLPAVQSLTWKHGIDTEHTPTNSNVEQAARALFAGLPHTLQIVYLSCITAWTLPLFRHIFSLLGSVHSLVLEDCDNDSVYGVLCALCPGWDGDETTYLPSLKLLQILSSKSSHYDRDISSQILELYRRRSGVHGSPLTIEIFRGQFTDEAFEDMSEVTQAGFLKDREEQVGSV